MRWLPSTLFGRLVLVLLGGLLLAQLLGAIILLRDRATVLYEASGFATAQRIAGMVRIFDTLTPDQRRMMASAVSTADLHVVLGESPVGEEELENNMHASHLRAILRSALGPDRGLRVGILTLEVTPAEPGFHGPPIRSPMAGIHMGSMMGIAAPGISFRVQAQLQDGHWVTFIERLSEESFAWSYKLLLTLTVLLASVIILSLLAVRWLTRPLDALAVAADELGRNIRRAPLAEKGPAEVQRAAVAFNTMQARLQAYLHEREQMLAAVSHDLRTPITRLRLRAELIEDESMHAKFIKDLAEMETMTAEALDFLRGAQVDEPVQRVDVLALLESLQEDMRETGHTIQVSGQATPYPARPLALKRCLANLVGNAAKYGTDVRVQLMDKGNELRVIITDKGPGIPEDEIERVFEPFYRVEGSRGRETGGTGLGLSVARDIARAHGGELTLHNRPEGGLEVVLTLPR